MRNNRRVLLGFILAMLVLALPTTVLANKKLFKATLTTKAELHEVVRSTARGNAVFATNLDGSLRFGIAVFGLSGPATGAHLHGPATASENGPVVITLCGGPAPAAVASCTTDSSGYMSIQGTISSNLLFQWGITGQQLFEWLEAGLIYVNVHTAANPAGEVRGQLILQ